MSSIQTVKQNQKHAIENHHSNRTDHKKLLGWAIFAAVVIWMAAPVVKQNLDWHKRLRTEKRMSDVVQAQMRFQEENGLFPNNQNGLSWRVHLLPYLGECKMYEKFALNEPWDSPHNIKLLKRMPDIYRSEGLVKRTEPGKTVFLRPVGNGAFPMSADDTSFSIQLTTQELSNTVFLVEIDPDQAVNWTQPLDYEFDPDQPRKHLTRARGAGCNTVCMGNASIWWMTFSYNPPDLKERFIMKSEMPKVHRERARRQ